MISPLRTAALPPADSSAESRVDRTRTARMAALVAFVWTIAALPFASGLMQCPTAQYFHFPCPGCGMTRAFRLLADGQIAASLAMHPLAIPTALSQIALALASVVATVLFGAPWLLVRAKWGRAVIAFIAIVMVLDVILWTIRFAGAFGGPVAVS
jgi:hypothetical protein